MFLVLALVLDVWWESWVEIEHYFVAYLDHVIAFEALYHRTSVKAGLISDTQTYQEFIHLCTYDPHH